MVSGGQREESLHPVQLGEEAKAYSHDSDQAGVSTKSNAGLVYAFGVAGKCELFPRQICRKKDKETG